MLRTARWVTGSFLRDFILFALVFAWMSQLLSPFAEATGIPSTGPFLWFIGLLFAIDLLTGIRWLRFVLKVLTVFAFVYVMYYPQYSVVDWMWLLDWSRDLYYGVLTAYDGAFDLVAESVRTTGCFIAMWLVQSLFRQSLRSNRWMFAFLLIGATALGMMDTFFVKSAKWQTVMFVLIGLATLAFMQLPSIERVARMPQRIKGWPMEWLAWTLVLSLVMVGTSSAAPKKQDPSWPDPVSFFEAKYAKGTASHQKIGYGNNDSTLGGPFDMDDTVVFTVKTTTEGYYRGETKVAYTGKGWESSALGLPVPDPANLKPLDPIDETTLETKTVEQTYEFSQTMVPRVFSEYRMTGVTEASAGVHVARFSMYDSRLDLDELNAGAAYKVVSQIPYLDEQKLKAAAIPWQDPALRMYLQLPNELPRRVADLAHQVTANATTPYEKAQALRDYLRYNYTYETKDVPVPAEGQDFVDQFLFDSKRGYCDHFSSSMVVMARTLGMPARWVKGFTKGDVDLSYKNPNNKDEYLYTVRNKNAHSWAEIYFDGVGWVDFEPTSNFSMPENLKQTEDKNSPVLPLPDTKKKDKQQPEDDTTPNSNNSASFTINWTALGKWAAGLVAVLLIIAFFMRRRLITSYYLRRAYKGDGNDAVTQALLRLLFVMERFGWKRRTDMTLREYALELSSASELRGREMIPFAKIFEQVRYGRKEVTDKERLQIRDYWNRLIRKAGRFKRK